jgi:hypothetical protein
MNAEKRRVIGAHVSFRNTAESDALPEVEHDVTVARDDRTTEVVRLSAACPMTAIERVRMMSAQEYATLVRLESADTNVDESPCAEDVIGWSQR